MRKFIACADLHIRSNKPQYRKDDYFSTVCRKFEEIISLANKHDADLLIAGDMFDSVKIGYKVLNKIIKILLKLKGTCYATAGQHDMAYHTLDLEASPFKTLILTDKIVFLNRKKSVNILADKYESKDVRIYGCSFGEKHTKPNKEYFNILVIHKTITPAEPPFFLTDAISAEEMLDHKKSYGYNLIISGDFHESFVITKWDSMIVNCGPMMREKIDQVDVEPKVYLISIDGDERSVKAEPIKLTIESAEDVFSLDLIKKADEGKFSEGLEELVKTLKNKSKRPDYRQTINLIMKEVKTSKDVKNKVEEVWGKVING